MSPYHDHDTWERELGDDEEPLVPRWLSRSLWPAILAVAFLVYELTAQPGMGFAVACARFGWDDLLTSIWLRRRDPVRSRGAVCFWFYIAGGLWKISVIATGAMFGCGMLQGILGVGPGAQPPTVLLAAVVVAFVGFLLCSFATAYGVMLACRSGTRVWLDPAVHRSRRERAWPPRHSRGNRARAVLMTAAITLATPVALAAMLVYAAILQIPRRAPAPAAPGIAFVAGMLFLMVSAALGVLVLLEVVTRRIVALDPAQCWEAGRDETSDFGMTWER